jgi:hypothetical protein
MQTVMGDPSIHGFATLAGKSFLPGQIAASSPAGAWRYTALSRIFTRLAWKLSSFNCARYAAPAEVLSVFSKRPHLCLKGTLAHLS